MTMRCIVQMAGLAFMKKQVTFRGQGHGFRFIVLDNSFPLVLNSILRQSDVCDSSVQPVLQLPLFLAADVMLSN